MDVRELAAAIDVEYERLGLDKLTSPSGNVAGTVEGLEQYLTMLRRLPVGATWRDIDPEIPAHWDLDDDSTWTEPYEPYGDWDYQQTPAGCAVMVAFKEFGEGAKFAAVIERAKAAGFVIYGAGMQYTRESPNGPRSTNESNWGIIVLPLGASDDEQWALYELALKQPEVFHARPDRREDAVYYPSEG